MSEYIKFIIMFYFTVYNNIYRLNTCANGRQVDMERVLYWERFREFFLFHETTIKRLSHLEQ